jgi:hypothetical protein
MISGNPVKCYLVIGKTASSIMSATSHWSAAYADVTHFYNPLSAVDWLC